MFYVTLTAKRKNAKRHIQHKCNTMEEVKKWVDWYKDSPYIVGVYTGKWEKVEVNTEE